MRRMGVDLGELTSGAASNVVTNKDRYITKTGTITVDLLKTLRRSGCKSIQLDKRLFRCHCTVKHLCDAVIEV